MSETEATSRRNALTPRVAQVLQTSYAQAGTLGLVSKFPQSDAFEEHTVLRGTFFPPHVEISADGQQLTVAPTQNALVFEGQPYVELTNSSALNWRGQELIVPRAVRPYENHLDLTAGKFNGPTNYVSDVLLGSI